MFDVSLKLDHSLPFCGLSKEFPSVSMQRWCNLQVDILELQSSREEEAEKLEPALKKMLKGLGARLIRFNRYSSKNVEAVIGCRCATDNSTVAMIEWAGCIPVMPVNYRGGLEYCRVLAFTKDSLNGAISSLSKVSKLEIENKSVIPRVSARGAITVPVDEFLGTLTKKQLAAFIVAMHGLLRYAQGGYHRRDRLRTGNEEVDLRGAPAKGGAEDPAGRQALRQAGLCYLEGK